MELNLRQTVLAKSGGQGYADPTAPPCAKNCTPQKTQVTAFNGRMAPRSFSSNGMLSLSRCGQDSPALNQHGGRPNSKLNGRGDHPMGNTGPAERGSQKPRLFSELVHVTASTATVTTLSKHRGRPNSKLKGRGEHPMCCRHDVVDSGFHHS